MQVEVVAAAVVASVVAAKSEWLARQKQRKLTFALGIGIVPSVATTSLREMLNAADVRRPSRATMVVVGAAAAVSVAAAVSAAAAGMGVAAAAAADDVAQARNKVQEKTAGNEAGTKAERRVRAGNAAQARRKVPVGDGAQARKKRQAGAQAGRKVPAGDEAQARRKR